jgi:hypothetical protein
MLLGHQEKLGVAILMISLVESDGFMGIILVPFT